MKNCKSGGKRRKFWSRSNQVSGPTRPFSLLHFSDEFIGVLIPLPQQGMDEKSEF